ncbi:hypothetical protein [Streptomyces sp. NPDC059515]|uniref:hypothetical protein n=1 Tax=Streptomyces sp. NPDC059515 TaxID=3346854 RepID=UPI0036C82313
MYQLDDETLEQIAQQILTEPSNAYFWDDRLFNTHGAVLSWAEYGDSILDESNYLSALDLIRAAADDGRNDTEISDKHVIDGTSRHWAVGSLRTIYVQVREDYEPCDFTGCTGDAKWWREGVEIHSQFCDDHREEYEADGLSYEPLIPPFTAAFIEAAEIITALQDYPVLDESDYSDREYERFQSNLNEAVEYVQRDFEDDTEEQSAAISERAYEELGELLGQHADGWVDSDRVEEIYREARDAYFTELGNAYLNAPIEGQLSLV